MKQKSDWLIYRFLTGKLKTTGESVISLSTWSKNIPFWIWKGIVTEEQIREILSNKQFQQWKRGERTEFMRHLTIEERKQILKLNNKKKNAN